MRTAGALYALIRQRRHTRNFARKRDERRMSGRSERERMTESIMGTPPQNDVGVWGVGQCTYATRRQHKGLSCWEFCQAWRDDDDEDDVAMEKTTHNNTRSPNNIYYYWATKRHFEFAPERSLIMMAARAEDITRKLSLTASWRSATCDKDSRTPWRTSRFLRMSGFEFSTIMTWLLGKFE